jgi:hypothetical protein
MIMARLFPGFAAAGCRLKNPFFFSTTDERKTGGEFAAHNPTGKI